MVLCGMGGASDRRHNRIRDWLARIIHALTGQDAVIEQLVPKWDRIVKVNGTDTLEHARLDVAFLNGRGQRVYLDVVVPTAGTTNPETARSRAARDGAAAARAADGKRVRYPGPDLVPFAIEALGRPGRDASAFLRSLAPSDPGSRSAALGSAWQSLSVVLQTGNAELLLSAAGAVGSRTLRSGARWAPGTAAPVVPTPTPVVAVAATSAPAGAAVRSTPVPGFTSGGDLVTGEFWPEGTRAQV